jgi:F-type H+-transporting ATPase subunit c
MKRCFYLAPLVALSQVVPADAFAQAATTAAEGRGMVGLGVALTMGLAALGGTMAQGKAVTSALDSIGRNPGASGKLFLPMILGLALIESLVILSFVIAFLLQGKL